MGIFLSTRSGIYQSDLVKPDLDSKRKMKPVQGINEYCKKRVLSEEDKAKLLSLQASLDNLFIQRAQVAYVRSRAKWIEQGEKSTSYFFGLKRRRHEKNSIDVLMVNNRECSDSKTISKEIHRIYSKLYSSSYSTEDSLLFLGGIKQNIPEIDVAFKELCDSELNMKELDTAVKQMSDLTSNFYKFFWEDIKEMLLNALKECIENNHLITTRVSLHCQNWQGDGPNSR